ncbi:hypothetical protein Pcinc_008820 [Petrolisthes cinctipes]|uniref:Nuclear receptor domain-containing protein n=1 Tax=Petrolisthes cinctipes TaxID=88211 RepID=A0AAE1G6L7_PETCI|nr:hypothetical protein Pcinc_008820 [Petrolisthes cinctipes]
MPCSVCAEPTASQRSGIPACRACLEFNRCHRNDRHSVCVWNGNCNINQRSRADCAPCRLQKCIEAGLATSTTQLLPPCSVCDVSNPRRCTITCAECSHHSHLTCVYLTRAQANTLHEVWLCQDCINTSTLAQAVDDHQEPADPAPNDIVKALTILKASTPVHHYVPRRDRHRVATDLAAHIHSSLEEQTVVAWYRLLSYAYIGLCASATTSNTNNKPRTHDRGVPEHPLTQQTPSNKALMRGICNKCADGDIRGTLHLLTTSDSVITPDDEDLTVLRAKHPAALPDEVLPRIEENHPSLMLMAEEVQAAIHTMPPGSAAGLDGVRPMHLQQLISKNNAEAGRHLIRALTALCNCTAAGYMPDHDREAFFFCNLTAIGKKCGGYRPIAVGIVYRRLAGKLVAQRMSLAVAAGVQPLQLGVGTPLGCEAVVHAVHEFTTTHDGHHEHIIVKVDMVNAFNSVSRKAVLEEVIHRFPAAMPLVSQAYSQPTLLQLSSARLWSQWGVQQSDPMGPLLFALAIDPVIRSLTSPLNVWFLDDGTLAGQREAVMSDLNQLIPAFQAIGLEVNQSKCELITLDTPENIAIETVPAKYSHLSAAQQLFQQAELC